MSESQTYIGRPFSKPRRSFARDSNELVDVDAYLEYLPDDPEEVPLVINTANKDEWVYQHVYFQRLFYTQKGVSEFMKDVMLSQFCETPYNQIGMRPDRELELHRTFEEHVMVPPPESIKKAMSDFKYLDVLGAAAIGRRVSLVPEAIENLVPGMGIPKNRFSYSPLERAEFFDRELEGALQALASPLVTSQRVVTGAIKRLMRIVDNKRLEEEAQRRIAEDEVYFPVRLRTPGFYYQQGREMVKNMSSVKPLQTEVGQVQLAS